MLKKIKNRKVLILLFLLSIPSFSALIRQGYFPMHDDMQAMRLLQIDKCVKDGQFPCRWVPDMGYGYGYPQFNYYAPFPYYIMESVHLLGFSYLDSVKASFIFSVFVGAIGMYILGKKLWGETGAFISTIIFIYAPYRALDMYVRGAVGEFWALSILPFIFWSSLKVIEEDKKARFWLALFIAALLTSHNITTLVFIPVFLAWVLYLTFFALQNSTLSVKSFVKEISFGFLWGFLISSFFIIPAYIEKSYVHVETLLQGYFNYKGHFASIGQLLFSTYWGFGSSETGSFDDLSLSIGILTWTIPVSSLFVLFLLKKWKSLKLTLFLVSIGFISLFLIHPKSEIIWSNVTILHYLQFPWRFLVISVFTFSVAAGSLGKLFPGGLRKNIGIIGLIALVSLLLNASFFSPHRWIDITDKEKFSGVSWDRQLTISIFDYLPKSADRPPWQEAFKMPVFAEGEGRVIKGLKRTDMQVWELDVKSESLVRLPIYQFPGWEIKVNDKVKDYSFDNTLGLITFDLENGSHLVTAKLKNTLVRSLSNIFSVIGLILVPIYLSKLKLW